MSSLSPQEVTAASQATPDNGLNSDANNAPDPGNDSNLVVSGKSRHNIDQAGTLVAGVAFSVLMAEAIPGFAEAQLAFMVLDIIDPYGYAEASKVFSRAGLDGMSYTLLQRLDEALPDIITTMRKNKDQYCPDCTPDEWETYIARAVSPFSLHTATPSPTVECFPDIIDQPSSVSGVPTNKCDPVYRGYYQTYVQEHGSEYTTNVGVDYVQRYVERENEDLLLGITFETDARHQQYTTVLYLALGVVLAAVIAVVLAVLLSKPLS